VAPFGLRQADKVTTNHPVKDGEEGNEMYRRCIASIDGSAPPSWSFRRNVHHCALVRPWLLHVPHLEAIGTQQRITSTGLAAAAGNQEP
jgi:hypothetical protein